MHYVFKSFHLIAFFTNFPIYRISQYLSNWVQVYLMWGTHFFLWETKLVDLVLGVSNTFSCYLLFFLQQIIIIYPINQGWVSCKKVSYKKKCFYLNCYSFFIYIYNHPQLLYFSKYLQLQLVAILCFEWIRRRGGIFHNLVIILTQLKL